MAKKVYLDPGHGGHDSGAVGVDRVLEKLVNLQVSRKVEKLLKKQNVEVKLSRSDDRFISLSGRANDANKWGADCFVSIHCNAFNGNAKGVETYAYSSKSDDLAEDIQEEILKSKAYTLNRGVKTARYSVLRNTHMRAALVELGFIDNNEDVQILTKKQNELALAIAKGICKYLNIEYVVSDESDNVENGEIPPVSDSGVFYRVVCGSFNSKVYAEEQVEKLKELGVENAFIAVYKKED